LARRAAAAASFFRDGENGLVFPAGDAPACAAAIARLDSDPALRARVADAIANLVLSLVLVRFMGVAGVALGTLIPTFLVRILWILPLTARFTERPLGARLREACLPGLLAGLPAAGALGLLLWLAPVPAGAGLPDLAWRGALVGAATLAGTWRHLRALRHA
jgi:peptidoglycan biosynthesis protein MviN/MurJ (putative lipid II flippase)